MIKITPIERSHTSEITRIVCPCGAKVRRVGLRKGSKVEGLTFCCDKCGKVFEVTTE
jgi:hypothetical protein